MGKDFPKELSAEVFQILKELSEQQSKSQTTRIKDLYIRERAERSGNVNLTRNAIAYLEDMYALDPNGSSLRITAVGWDYWEKLTTWTPWYWFKKNLFPASVAFGTILFGGASAAANIVSLVL